MRLRSKHVKSGVHLECANNSLEEINYILMLFVVGAIASHIESGCAGRVFGELVSPEVGIGVTLVDPVLVHYISSRRVNYNYLSTKQSKVRTVIQQRESSELNNEGVDTRTLVGRNGGTVRLAGSRVRRRCRVELPCQITVLCEAPINR